MEHTSATTVSLLINQSVKLQFTVSQKAWGKFLKETYKLEQVVTAWTEVGAKFPWDVPLNLAEIGLHITKLIQTMETAAFIHGIN